MSHLSSSAAAMAAVVRAISPGQLSAPTPCAGYDVRALVNHLLFWGPSLAAAGRKETVPPPAAAESEVDLTTGDWAGTLLAQLDRTVAAWSAPGAWEGTTRVIGPDETPAEVIGGMVVGELAVHAWDLAAATGQTPEFDDDLLDFLVEDIAAGAEMGRRMGIYGPEVAMPADAPALHRVLGLTGRDPAWTTTVRS